MIFRKKLVIKALLEYALLRMPQKLVPMRALPRAYSTLIVLALRHLMVLQGVTVLTKPLA